MPMQSELLLKHSLLLENPTNNSFVKYFHSDIFFDVSGRENITFDSQVIWSNVLKCVCVNYNQYFGYSRIINFQVFKFKCKILWTIKTMFFDLRLNNMVTFKNPPTLWQYLVIP